jgi:serine phosphatase RsbU (regulator of sigma subunit)
MSNQPHSRNTNRELADMLALAGEVQASFFPRKTPAVSGYQFFSHYKPAHEIGGDHFDFIKLGNGRVAVLILDVAGKDVPASLLKARLSGAVRVLFLCDSDPVPIVRKLNTFLCEMEGERFATMAVALLDPARHNVEVVNAGHLPPLLFRPHQGLSKAIPEARSSLPLGVLDVTEYESHHVSLQPGECVILFTDGVPDAQGAKGDRLGMDRIANIIHKDYPYSPSALGRKLISAVEEHATGNSQFDDIALVCFGRVV